jgi:hypothetical protein
MKANVQHILAELQVMASRQGLTMQEKHGRYRLVKKFSLLEPAIEWVEVVTGGGYSLSLDDVRNVLMCNEVERGRLMTTLRQQEPKST